MPNEQGPRSARQLTLDIARRPSFDADDFLVAPSNEAAHRLLSAWPGWPERVLVVVGPPGCGKSHLAAIWAERARATIVRCPETLKAAVGQSGTIALVEDGDRVAYDEADLFHLINLAREGGALVLTSRVSPQAWGVRTPDLLSRLRLAPLVEVRHPEAPLISAVMVKLFADRQIRIDADVVAYAARHCEQSLEAVNRFVAAVDDESLAEGRRITRPLAARIMTSLHDGEGDDSGQGPT